MSQVIVMKDSDHPLMYDQIEDDSQAAAHDHYSRLTVSDCVVVKVEWGFHSTQEAFVGPISAPGNPCPNPRCEDGRQYCSDIYPQSCGAEGHPCPVCKRYDE